MVINFHTRRYCMEGRCHIAMQSNNLAKASNMQLSYGSTGQPPDNSFMKAAKASWSIN